MNAFRTLILTASVTPLAQQIAATLSPAGAGMWTTGLSADGAAPATHFISTGYIGEDFAHMVPSQTWEQIDGEWTQTGSAPGSPVAVLQACTAAGMEVTLGEIQAVFAAADVTEEEPFVAMARGGLHLVSLQPG